jgi:hypothetical protein
MFWRRRKRIPPLTVEQLVREGTEFYAAFERDGQQELLDRAIDRFSQALALLPADLAISRGVLNELALCFDRRGRAYGTVGDLDHAVDLLTTVVQQAPRSEDDRPFYRLNLALALRHRYEQSGERADLDRALAIDEEVFLGRLLAADDRALAGNNLAKDLSLRFLETSQISDLDRAIELQQEALTLVPDGDPQRYGFLNNMAAFQIDRYRLRGDRTDLDEAIAALELALSLVPPASADRPGTMQNLGHALGLRAARDESEDDSGRGVKLLMDVLQVAAPGTGLYNEAVLGVAEAFVDRYPYTHDAHLLHDAVKLTDYLLSVWPDESIDPTVFWTRANAFRLLHETSRSANDRGNASASAQKACELGMLRRPMNTLHSAREWAAWAEHLDNWAEAAKAYEWCLQATRMLFGHQDLRQHKEEWLVSTIGLASDAPYGFARAARLDAAVLAAEQCRAALLSEFLLQRDVDLESLRDGGRPDLSDRYVTSLAALRRLQVQEDLPLAMASGLA